jgi:ABC-2 type transport system permease protein
MIRQVRRFFNVYGAIAASVPKVFLAYRVWFWVGIFLNVVATAIYVYFWRAVYAETQTIAGLDLQQTLNYILLGRVFGALLQLDMLFEFGYNLREGGMAILLLRPLNLQASYFVDLQTRVVVSLILQIPLALIATFVFGLQWPTDPLVWAAFIVTVILGRTALFFFDWLLGCFTFYTTEVWGLSVLLEGVAMFFSGSILPLVMMPGWLQAAAQSLPFAQALYMPLAVLTGIIPLAQVGQVWLVQVAWIAGLALLSSLFFRVALRKVTVQGG